MSSGTRRLLGPIWEYCPEPWVPASSRASPRTAGSPHAALTARQPLPPKRQGICCPRRVSLKAVLRTLELMKRKLIPGPAAATGCSQSWGCFSVCLFVLLCFVFPGKNSHQINLKQSLTIFFLTFPLLQPCHSKPSKQNSMRQTPASQLLMPTAIA